MNTLIKGSGFGLYGYLPAIYSFSKTIYLEKKYKKILKKRSELTKYSGKVKWFSKISDLKKINIVVIAQRPNDQIASLKKLIKLRKNFKHIFLEKPFGKSPTQSLELLKILQKNKLKFSFGFLFKFLKWYKVLNTKTSNDQIRFVWHIKKNNLNKKWKYDKLQGGGLLRYYGIHIIDLIYDLKFNIIKKNLISENKWNSEFVDKNKNHIIIDLKFSKKDEFYIIYNKKKISDFKNPFLASIKPQLIDPRIVILKKYIKNNLKKKKINYKYSLNLIHFWKKIENEKFD